MSKKLDGDDEELGQCVGDDEDLFGDRYVTALKDAQYGTATCDEADFGGVSLETELEMVIDEGLSANEDLFRDPAVLDSTDSKSDHTSSATASLGSSAAPQSMEPIPIERTSATANLESSAALGSAEAIPSGSLPDKENLSGNQELADAEKMGRGAASRAVEVTGVSCSPSDAPLLQQEPQPQNGMKDESTSSVVVDAERDATLRTPPRDQSKVCGKIIVEHEEAKTEQTHDKTKEDKTQQACDMEKADRVPQCGVKITNRLVSATTWNTIMEKRQYVPFSQLSILADKDSQTKDRVIVGVVYQTRSEKASGRALTSLQWEMTDLSRYNAATLSLKLVSRAFMKFANGEDVNAQVGRGSIVAVMNAELVSSRSGSPPFLMVGNAGGVLKLGDCPSLGWCRSKLPNGKPCPVPCNLDTNEKHCRPHMDKAWTSATMVQGRSGFGGLRKEATSELQMLMKKTKHKNSVLKGNAIVEARAPVERRSPSELGKQRAEVAAHNEQRRLDRREVNDDYIRAIAEGRRPDSNFTSHVPMLGRSFCGEVGDQDVSLEFSTEQFTKAERLMDEYKWRKQHANSASIPMPKRQRNNQSNLVDVE